MTQVDVTFTDYGLAFECGAFACLLTPRRGSTHSIALSFRIFFLSICAASLAGGTVHGFFLDEASLGYRILWPFTLIMIGITSVSGIQIASYLQFPSASARITTLALLLFAIYCGVVLWVRRDFLIAILAYLPAVLLLEASFWLAWRRQRRSAYLTGFLGLAIMLVAAAAQQAKLGIDPVYFNHNAVYHVLQAIGLFMVFAAARECRTQERPQ